MFMKTFKKVRFSPLFCQKIYKIHKTKNVPHEKLEKEKWGQNFVLVDFKWRNTTPKVELLEKSLFFNFEAVKMQNPGKFLYFLKIYMCPECSEVELGLSSVKRSFWKRPKLDLQKPSSSPSDAICD